MVKGGMTEKKGNRLAVYSRRIFLGKKTVLPLGLIVLLTLLFRPVFVYAEIYTEILSAGLIDWSNGVIEATGTAEPPRKTANQAQARALAAQEAETTAKRNLIETLSMLRVDSDHFAKEVVLTPDLFDQKMKKTVYNTAAMETFFLSGNRVKRVITLDLRGTLANILLPKTIREIDQIKGGTVEGNSISSKSPKRKPHTGLVIDCRGLRVTPALVPRILDEDGNEIYGPAVVNRKDAVAKGAASYSKNFEDALRNRRVGANPLQVKAVSASGKNSCDIIISNADAARIIEVPANLNFLRTAGVMIVLD
jgi:hypothetical protein